MTQRQARQLAADVHKRYGKLACAVPDKLSGFVVQVALSGGLALVVRSWEDVDRAQLADAR